VTDWLHVVGVLRTLAPIAIYRLLAELASMVRFATF
jgi:hypothetical protein